MKESAGWLPGQVSRMGVSGSRSQGNWKQSKYMENAERSETDVGTLGKIKRISSWNTRLMLKGVS